MPQQKTIREAISYSGVGLHSGHNVTMTFLPAPAGSGLRFRRVDLEGKPEIEAQIDNVSETNRSTTLSKGAIKIHTVEHVLACFAGFGIDNAVIELDANEPPICDGSAREFCRMISTAGIALQEEEQQPFPVTSPIEVKVGETDIAIFPCDRLKISCTSADKQGRFTQYYSLELTPESWEKELSDARTFCFYEEIEFLIQNGLIKGGSLENAVVIRDDAVLTTEPLRYVEEFVRHKMLDIVGDLALLGRPVHGHIVAIKPSHAANCELARQIHAQWRRSVSPGPVVSTAFAPGMPPPKTMDQQLSAETSRPPETPLVEGAGAMDVIAVMRLLPHRYPFLMVDRILKVEGNRIVAVKNVSINEPYFQGHFPQHPIMPGVLQLEAMAQVGGILMLVQAENQGKIAYFMSAEKVKWRKPVRPGDRLIIDVELTKSRGKIGKARGACLVDEEIVSEGEVTFMLTDG